MRRAFPVFAGIVTLALAAGTAQASMLSFQCITSGAATDCAIGEAQMLVEVTDPGGNQVKFTFTNTGPAASSITDVYFDDGTLLGISSIINSSGVDFEGMAAPGNLPGGNNASPPFVTSAGFFSTDSSPPVARNGVNPSETLMIFFDLLPGTMYADVLQQLGSGQLRIGLHVQAFADGGSVSLVNSPAPVPLPAALWLFVPALGVFGALRRRSAVH
jgi:hypothetical protein